MKRNFISTLVLLLSLFLLSLSSCKKEPEEKGKQETKQGEVTFLAGEEAPAEGAPLPSTPNASHTAILPEDAPLVMAGNTFSFKLMKELLTRQEERKNLVISPISIETALGMNALGLSDEAFREYCSVMGFPKATTSATMSAYLKRLDEALTTAGSLPCYFPANSLWVSSKYQEHLIKSYPQQLFEVFKATSVSLDLSNPASYEKINQWINRKTYGRIKDMLNPKMAEENDALAVLVNAAFFAASWDWFISEEETRDGKFINADAVEEPAKMMSIDDKGKILFAENDRFECVSVGLIRANEDEHVASAPFKMMLLLPKDAKASLENVLPSAEELSSFLNSSVNIALHMLLPRLDTSTPTLDLTRILGELGMVQSLGNPITSMSRMFDYDFLASLLKGRHNNVLHKASLKWNEQSVEAAAATVVVVGATDSIDEPDPREITFNRPFFAFIVHPESGKILFSAAINTLQ